MSAAVPTAMPHQAIIRQKGKHGWNDLYEQQLTPWDLGRPTPALVELLDSDDGTIFDGGPVLIPGCGLAYDVGVIARMAKNASHVTGIDISPLAVERACEILRSSYPLDVLARSTVRLADFWEFKDEARIVFDYTFFCAIEPTQRPMWGQKMREILSHPGDKLITLMFPLGKEGADGPPFSVSHEAYADVLEPHFHCIRRNPHCRSDPSREGMESLVIWERS